ncbi:MAG: hypothetical protein AAFV37_09165 [Pseudomonadota bacterium]
MAKVLFIIAAVLGLLGALAHEVLGAPMVLGPLSETDLPKDVIWLHHFSWHVGTIAVLSMVGLFLLAARRKDGWIFGAIATATSAGFAALGIGLAAFGDSVLWTTPAPYPWTLIAIIGTVSVVLSKRAQAASESE